MTWKDCLRLLPLAALFLLGLTMKFLLPHEPADKLLVRLNARSTGPCPVTPSPSGARAEPWRMRYGVDLALPKGTSISAASDGVVVFAGACGSYGNVVVVHHMGDAVTLYAHLSDPKDGLRKGSVIREGDVVGQVGPAEGIKASHLHFEVWDEKGEVPARPAAHAPRASQAIAGGN